MLAQQSSEAATAVAVVFGFAVIGLIAWLEGRWLRNKGYNPWWGLGTVFLGLIGVLIIAVLRDKRRTELETRIRRLEAEKGNH